MKKLYFLVLFIFLSLLQLNAQSIKNIGAVVSGSSVLISYDLLSSENKQKFNIVLKSSNDSFTAVLKEVTGDVGINQSVGTGKKIIWNAGKELGSFQGDISFEITATVTFSPLKFIKPTIDAAVKIGKPYTIKWEGGTLNRNLKLELLKNNSPIIDIDNIDNVGSYTWNVPKTMEKGDRFQFKLFDPTKPNDAIMSATFKLKKTPILIYVGVGTVVAGIAAIMLLSGKDNGGGDGAVNCATNPSHPSCILPGPPNSPNGN